MKPSFPSVEPPKNVSLEDVFKKKNLNPQPQPWVDPQFKNFINHAPQRNSTISLSSSSISGPTPRTQCQTISHYNQHKTSQWHSILESEISAISRRKDRIFSFQNYVQHLSSKTTRKAYYRATQINAATTTTENPTSRYFST